MYQYLRMRYVWIFVVVGTLGVTTPAAAVDVYFPDANLEAKVRDTLHIPAPTPITDADMETMLSLPAGSSNISDIGGLEYGTNLTELELYANQISDISPISGLTNLNTLSLDNNHISDISPVSGLINLKTMYLDKNQISGISPVSGLTNLGTLYLDNNQISDISPISELTNLGTLSLHHNQISNISPVSELTNLNWLSLANNQISDISPVAELTNLYVLFLDNNQINTLDLSNSNLFNLYLFSISGNPLASVLLTNASFSQSGFKSLMTGGNDFSTGIAELGGVLSLDMSGVDFTDITDLSKMYTMDDLETLLLAGATNLDGSKVVQLTVELDSLDWLDVTGLWDSFDAAAQNSLRAWDAQAGNTLVVPEPAAVVLLLCGLLAGLIRWRKW